MHAERRRGRPRTRILYWFRTPPGVKVGRTALDDETRRRIEQQNPDIEFDWPRILKGGGSPATEPRPPADVRRGRQHEGRRESQPARQHQPAAPEPIGPAAPSPPDDIAEDEVVTPTADSLPADETAPSIPEAVDTPAHARLGPEGVAQLRARYTEIRSRIAERVTDPARRDELALTVERLNPDTWTTGDEVTVGLEQYEVVLASLRDVVGRRRRKRRRGGRRDPGAAAAGQNAAAGPDGESDESEDESADESGDDPGRDDSGSV